MGEKIRAEKRETERMSNAAFRGMVWLMNVIDFLHPYIKKRIEKFGIGEGMTVVDYGCGPGRYTVKFVGLVGDSGKIYAVDIHELAMECVRKKMAKYNIGNIELVLAKGYNSTLPDNIADVVCAIDMFFSIKQPSEFLAELKRITKRDGMLVIDDGHQSRQNTKDKIIASGCWDIVEETKDHLKCKSK
jgi:ubiquinone/menaquinone biosynthesis C-methylase UbiE